MDVNYFQNKKLTVLLAAFFIFICATPILMAQNPDTLLITDDALGQPGDTVSVYVEMANHSDSVGGILLILRYNPNIVQTDASLVLRGVRLSPLMEVVKTIYSESGIARILIYDPYGTSIIPIGSGPIMEVKFVIQANVPDGHYPIWFETDTTSGEYPNTMSDWLGYMIFPDLVDGSVGVYGGPHNDPPVFESLPSQVQGEIQSQVRIEVNATDPNGDAVTLTTEHNLTGAVFSTVGGSGTFTWTPTADGQYKVYFIASDDWISTRDSVFINIGGEINSAPVIYQVGTQSVAEGAHLEFQVKAYDVDGDFITLDVVNRPMNSTFTGVQGDSVVSDTFYFDPDFSQGPDTITVIFRAQDAYNHITDLNVTIIILDAPNDILEFEDRQGALPGSLGRSLIVNLKNAKPLYGLQFDLLYDPEVLDIFTVSPDSTRAFDMAFFSRVIEDGRYRVMIYSPGLDTIPTGIGKIVEFGLDVDPSAVIGPSEVTFDSATSVQDSAGGSKEMLFVPGFYTIDVLGDANLDCFVSVGDCVAIVAHVIGWIELDLRAFDAADYNRDGDVRIIDLMEVTNSIMGISIPPSPPIASAGDVELLRDDLYPGFIGEVPLWLNLEAEAAAVQFTIEYDPSEVHIYEVKPGEMISNLELKYTDTGDKIKAAIYNFDRSVFGPTSGELVNFDMEYIGNDTDPKTAIRLTDFEIVSVDAFLLGVDILGELPVEFRLSQNYPNPFNANTIISFDMPVSSFVRVDVYNVLGQVVKELYSGYLEAGPHQVIWNGSGSNGMDVTSGIYFYRFQADGFDKSKKMLLVK